MAEAFGGPPYVMQPVDDGQWNEDGQQAATALHDAVAESRPARATVFTQQCTKHATFWVATANKHLQWSNLDLVVPLRDPREYPMSREAFDLSRSQGAKGEEWSTSKKIQSLKNAFQAMEVSPHILRARAVAPRVVRSSVPAASVSLRANSSTRRAALMRGRGAGASRTRRRMCTPRAS